LTNQKTVVCSSLTFGGLCTDGEQKMQTRKKLTRKEISEYIAHTRTLPSIGPITFGKMITDPRVKKALNVNKNKQWTIDDAVFILQELFPGTLFFKSDKMAWYAEHQLNTSRRRAQKFKEKCDVQLNLWKMMRPKNKSRDSIDDERLETFFIFERVGNGRFKYIDNPRTVLGKEEKVRKAFLKKSRIDPEEVSL